MKIQMMKERECSPPSPFSDLQGMLHETIRNDDF